jgi:hypothetical protein
MRSHKVLFVLIAFLSLSTPAAHAIECIVSGPHYGLTSDILKWSIKIVSGQSCIRGLRFNNVVIESLKLVFPPQTGQVILRGPSFVYSAKSEYGGEDSFTVAVSGTINKLRGSSIIQITVSVESPPSAAISHVSSPDLTAVSKPPVTTPVDSSPPQPVDGSLPRCPTWDWSKGAPPPMRPPFDRSKLYCPPPPFKPPGQPIGCRCEN